MTFPRKRPSRKAPGARRLRARHVPAIASTDLLLIEAAGVAAERVLIVTCDHAGGLRMWCNGADPFEGLALSEYARSRLLADALRRDPKA